MSKDWRVIHGDSGEVLESLQSSFDSMVTDPPAGISFMGKQWDGAKGGRDRWIAWLAGIMMKARRLLKPGAHCLVWAIPRTSHWTAMSLEDAGFEVRDVITHLFGTGFPKSLNVSRTIDKLHGENGVVIGKGKGRTGEQSQPHGGSVHSDDAYQWPGEYDITEPVTDDARRWKGYGTALKPAAEHWILCRNPLSGNIVETVLEHGTGVLNIDGCRIGTEQTVPRRNGRSGEHGRYGKGTRVFERQNPPGRWPANVVLSYNEDCEGSCSSDCPVQILDEQSGDSVSRSGGLAGHQDQYVGGRVINPIDRTGHDDKGGASRFFYTSKAGKAEREIGLDGLPHCSPGEATGGRAEGSKGLDNPRAGAGRTSGARNHHPTVKSLDLMQWLVRLVTPASGHVLDPFCGSGSTGCAALLEGMRFTGIELSEDYADIARRRISHVDRHRRLVRLQDGRTVVAETEGTRKPKKQHSAPLFAGFDDD